MTRPTETRMSPLGAKVGEGAHLSRRRRWLTPALTLSALPFSIGSLFVPWPFDAAAFGVALVLLALALARMDT